MLWMLDACSLRLVACSGGVVELWDGEGELKGMKRIVQKN